MKTAFVFLTILASALCPTLPCGHSFVIKPVIHKVHASSCVSIHRKAHYIPFYFGCKGGETPTPVINPIVGPVLPRPILPAPIQGGGRTFTPIVGGGGAGINRLLQIQ